MRRFLPYIVILTASWALAGCGGSGGGSSVAPVTSDNALAGAVRSPDQQAADAASRNRIAALVRGKVKHVFVLVQENHTFDQLFGLFPGVNGHYVENLGTYLAQETDCEYDPETLGCQRPFLISPNTNSPNYVEDAPDITGGNNGRYDQEVGIDLSRRCRGRTARARADPEPSTDRSAQRVDRHRGRIRLRHRPVSLVLREKLRALRSLLPGEHRRLDPKQHSALCGSNRANGGRGG